MSKEESYLIPDWLPDALHGAAVERLPRRRRQLPEERLEEGDEAVLVGVAVHRDVQDAAGDHLRGKGK